MSSVESSITKILVVLNKQPRRKRRGIFALRFARYAAHLRFTVPYQTLYFRTPQAARFNLFP
ncbi:hypothetical protein CCP3SC5AM1_890004 [Gammaproteobacteria bacterium]